MWIEPITLTGKHASLEFLSFKHLNSLIEASKDGELYKAWYTFVPSPDAMKEEIERRLSCFEKGDMLPFTVLDMATGRAVGMTTYMNIDSQHKRLEIGSTWLRKSCQGTAANTECKYMLLTHAFEVKKAIAVEFRTHYINRQSRQAIERLGAKLDGVLRNHMVSSNGTLRDTCVYSIIRSEWEVVKGHLAYLLDDVKA